MTSRSSFWDKCKENNKRRIWVWIISILSQIIFYPSILLVYLSRIRSFEATGYYRTIEDYRQALEECVTDAVAFQSFGRVSILLLLLAGVIGLQGFGWLHDRRKLDMYKSVPVKERDRFLAIYVNSILIYVLPYLGSLLISFIIAATQGALSGVVFAKCALASFTNIFYYLVNLHLTILVITLTGNWLIACAGIFILNVLDEISFMVFYSMQNQFFKAANFFFDKEKTRFCAFYEYFEKSNDWKVEKNLSVLSAEILPIFAKWALFAIVLGILAYICYRKRYAEAAGKAIAFPMVKPVIKVILAVIGALVVFTTVYSSSSSGTVISVLALVGAAVLFSGILEVIYEFDIKAAMSHLLSTGCTVILSLVIFCIYQFDIFGYDNYIPEPDKVESIAFFSGNYTQDYWEYMPDMYEEGVQVKKSVSASEYLRNNMFLHDTDAVRALAEKGIAFNRLYYRNDRSGQNTEFEGQNIKRMSILYRLTSGREVARTYLINLTDPQTAEIFDRIISTEEYREGNYLLAKHPEYLSDPETRIYYTNGSMQAELNQADAARIRDAWRTDMEQYDYTFAVENDMCGKVSVMFGNYLESVLPVYEDFTNTIAALTEMDAYYPLLPDVSDIESLTVTNYNHEDSEDSEDGYVYGYGGYSSTVARAYSDDRVVTVTYDDPEQIEAILQVIYPDDFDQEWKRIDTLGTIPSYLDTNYSITLAFKPDTDYPYKKVQDTFSPRQGSMPEFAVRDTTYSE